MRKPPCFQHFHFSFGNTLFQDECLFRGYPATLWLANFPGRFATVEWFLQSNCNSALRDRAGKNVVLRPVSCDYGGVTNQAAYTLRENTGTSGLVESARAAVEVLADHDIPHLIVGGLAVQEHGYERVTVGVDIVVPDVHEAVEILTANLSGSFYRVPESDNRLEDRDNGVLVDFLPAGKVLKSGCKVPFPVPNKITKDLQFVTLEELVSLKLGSWAGSPMRRVRDKSDVVELILRRKLPRDLAVASAVRALYTETWDALQAES